MTAAVEQPRGDVTDADPLGVALLTGLSRPFAAKQTPWIQRTAPAALVSFGVLPALRLGVRFRQFVTVEQQQFSHLAQWLGSLPGGQGETLERVRLAAEGVRYRRGVGLLMQIVVCATVAAAAWLGLREADPVRTLVHGTYLFPLDVLRGRAVAAAGWIFLIGTVGVSAAYVLHVYHVRLHARDRRRFVGVLNDALGRAGVAPMEAAEMPRGAYGSWCVLALFLCVVGGVWAIPLAMAASAHRRSIVRVSLRDRQAMARRVHTLLQRRYPSQTLALPVHLRPACGNEACGGPMRHYASYCPRCGEVKDAA